MTPNKIGDGTQWLVQDCEKSQPTMDDPRWTDKKPTSVDIIELDKKAKERLQKIYKRLNDTLEDLSRANPLLDSATYNLVKCEINEADNIAADLFKIQISQAVSTIRESVTPQMIGFRITHTPKHLAQEYLYTYGTIHDNIENTGHKIARELVILIAAYDEEAGNFDSVAEYLELIGKNEDANIALLKLDDSKRKPIDINNMPIIMAAVDRFKTSTKDYELMTNDAISEIIDKSKKHVAELLEKMNDDN